MKTADWKDTSVGKIVAENFAAAKVFKKYGIDFCCHGETQLHEACAALNLDVEEVIQALQHQDLDGKGAIPFASWPLDLLIDYILKIHHRGIRSRGPELMELLEKVERVHGEAHPELHELRALVSESLQDLEMHLQKEENVLFPYLYELYAAQQQGQRMEPMHCGTIANPIRVMKMEHEGEGNRYLHIIELTRHFSVPQDGCASYRLLMQELEAFVDALFEHIHLENNLLFPRFEEIERKIVF
ncbi:iron-sulfur cluster repair di-iron protein [Phocaeicola coprocola]|uniref:iron-sulfur cluster repair di-iron protein n=1 Tax=Phocaeicola coprocola TaxID=310298 RepID=UPI0032BF9F9A